MNLELLIDQGKYLMKTANVKIQCTLHLSVHAEQVENTFTGAMNFF